MIVFKTASTLLTPCKCIVIDQGIRKHFAEQCIELRDRGNARVQFKQCRKKEPKQKSHDTQTSHHEPEMISLLPYCAPAINR